MNNKVQENLYLEKFPSPHKLKRFKDYWERFIVNVADRDNFNTNHLKNLEILCQLYVDYDLLTEAIKKDGFSYEADTRYGIQIKTRPEVKLKTDLLSEIRQFSKLLGIELNKDQTVNDETSASEEWS